jgi:hypothetical protein
VLELALRHVRMCERLDDHIHGIATRILEAREALVDTAPAGADEVDEKCEVVDARVALGEKVAFDPLEAPNRLVQKAANLGNVPCDRKDLGTDAVAHGGTNMLGDRHLELCGGYGERLDLSTRTLERGLDRSRLGSPGRRVRDPLLGPFEREGVHGREATLSAGWTPRSSSTTYRAS